MPAFGPYLDKAARSLRRNKVAMAWLVFGASFTWRLAFGLSHPHFDNIFAVRGVPYSDGQQWTSGAIWLAHGEGLHNVLRPGLSVALALFYTWFGYSFQIITALNIVAGALTAVFIFLIGQEVFPGPITAAATCFFIFDPSQTIQVPQSTTEPLGLLLLVVCVYYLVLLDERGRTRHALLSGTFLALSNLTRPLTLFCAPFYAGHLFCEWRRARGLKRALLLVLCFCGGLTLTIAPWLVRQKAVHGVWALSTNLGEAFYGATSPKYKTWTSLVREDADRAGIEPKPGPRYSYFMSGALQNIRLNPKFYAGQVARSFWVYLTCFDREVRSSGRAFAYRQWTGLWEAQVFFAWITAGLLSMTALRIWVHTARLTGGVFLVVASLLFFVWCLVPPFTGALILALGISLSFTQCPRRKVTTLVISVLITGIGSALFNNAILYRVVLMTDWMFVFFYLAAFYFGAINITNNIASFLGSVPTRASGEPATANNASPLKLIGRRGIIGRISLVSLVLFLCAGAVRLLVLNLGSGKPGSPAPQELSTEAREQLIAHLREEFYASAQTPSSFVFDLTKNKKLLLTRERLSYYTIYFPRGTEFKERHALFHQRPFSCTIFPTSHGTAVFPGEIPTWLRGRLVILAEWVEGSHAVRTRRGEVTQCVAVIPVANPNGEPDYQHAVIVKLRPFHDIL